MFYALYAREEKILNSVCKDKLFWNWVKKRYNIVDDFLVRKFDNFYVNQLENNTAQHKDAKDVKWHFVSWLEKVLKKSYGMEIYETFLDFKSKPKELKNPMGLLTANQISQFSKELHMQRCTFKKYLDEYLKNVANDFRFEDFEDEKGKLFSYMRQRV